MNLRPTWSKLYYLLMVAGGAMAWFVFQPMQALSLLIFTIGVVGYFHDDHIHPRY